MIAMLKSKDHLSCDRSISIERKIKRLMLWNKLVHFLPTPRAFEKKKQQHKILNYFESKRCWNSLLYQECNDWTIEFFGCWSLHSICAWPHYSFESFVAFATDWVRLNMDYYMLWFKLVFRMLWKKLQCAKCLLFIVKTFSTNFHIIFITSTHYSGFHKFQQFARIKIKLQISYH